MGKGETGQAAEVACNYALAYQPSSFGSYCLCSSSLLRYASFILNAELCACVRASAPTYLNQHVLVLVYHICVCVETA